MTAPTVRRGAALLGLFLLALTPGPAAARSYMTGSFDSVVVRGDVAVDIVSGGAPAVVADGSPDDLDRLSVERSNQRLVIRMAPAPRTASRRGAPVSVRVSARTVDRIAIEGAGRVSLDRMKGRDLRVLVTGPGSLDVGSLAADRLILSVIGSGRVALAGGSATTGTMTLSGAATLDAPGFTADRLTISLSGASDAKIAVDEVARIAGGGAGRVEIGGRGDCVVEAAGTLDIICPPR